MRLQGKRLTAGGAIGFVVIPPVLAGDSSLDIIFTPFAYLNFASVYEKYAALIDLIIYFLIFLGAAQVTLGRRFPGQGGKALSIGTGIALTLAMILAEKQLGFTLKSFGPLAAGILLFMMGIVIYRLIHYAGMNHAGSGALAYGVTFLAMHAVAPGFFQWVNQTVPILNVLSSLAFIIAVIMTVNSFGSFGSIATRISNLSSVKSKEKTKNPSVKPELKQEAKEIKHQIRPVSRKEIKDSRQILRDLQNVYEAVKKSGNNPEARGMILKQMSLLVPKQHEAIQKVEALRLLNQRLMQLDLSLFSQEKRERFQSLSTGERRKYQQELKAEWEKLGAEKKIQEYTDFVKKYQQTFSYRLEAAARALTEGRTQECLQQLMTAMELERNCLSFFQKIQYLEKALQALTQHELFR